MFQRKYHTIIIDEKGDKRFFEGMYRNSSINYWKRYRDTFLKKYPECKFFIYSSKKDRSLVDKVKIIYPDNLQYIIISDTTYKREYGGNYV